MDDLPNHIYTLLLWVFFFFAVASFDIPFDRQQLADFLCVERAAMSVELSKLQKEGLLVTKRNHFELLTR